MCIRDSIGTGRNGKGTFINTIKHILGDYALQANFDSFTARKSGGGLEIRGDIARMAGARMVVASENEQDQRLAESLLKTLTGSDTITARKLYHEDEEFQPQFKLWFMVNNEPKIIGTDEGIWSRIHFIPWNVFIRAEDRIKTLKEDLWKEASGILNWMIEGLEDYQANGLVRSAEMQKAYDDFRKNSDQIQRFFDEKCVIGDGLEVQSSQLYSAYGTWTFETKEFQLRERIFNVTLERRGFTSKRKEKGRFWQGLALKPRGPYVSFN